MEHVRRYLWESALGKEGELEGTCHVTSGLSPLPTTPHLESEHMIRPGLSSGVV